MKKIILENILGLAYYEKVREKFRNEIIELKKKRRVSIGDRVSLVFENRETVIFQIQEMLRAEKISDLDKIREEIDVYNSSIPAKGELSATLFLEIEDQTRLREQILEFLGIDEALYLRIGDQYSIHAKFEEGRSKEDKISAVQYVRFSFSAEEIRAFKAAPEAVLAIEHPHYRASARLEADTRASLIEDLESE